LFEADYVKESEVGILASWLNCCKLFLPLKATKLVHYEVPTFDIKSRSRQNT